MKINQRSLKGITTAMRMLAFVMTFASVLSTQAQKTVTGTVTGEEDGQPLVGATVMIKGTVKGTLTNETGSFAIDVPSDESVLLISYVSMAPQEITVGNQTKFDVVMSADYGNLEEVVVTGYGSQKKANLSGAVDRVDIEQLENRPIFNLSQGLQGLVPNLNVDFGSGAPGSSANINIRGFTSINGGNPLIVVDGIPFPIEDLNTINPNDIESISVLKDASSAAIYGARAAFGVVLITTKKGTGSKISYSNNFSWASPTVTPDPVTDPYIFSRMLETSTDNTPWDYVNYSDEHFKWAKERSEDPSIPEVRVDPNNPNRWAYMGSNNWADYFFEDAAFSTTQNLSISGSSDKISYFFSGNFTNEDGLNKLATDDWQRYALRSKINIAPVDWFNIENNTVLTQVDRDQPSYNLVSRGAGVFTLRTLDVAENPDGTWAATQAGRLAAQMRDGGRWYYTEAGFNTITRANIILFDGMLKLTGDATFRRNYLDEHWDYRRYQIGFGPEDIRTEGGNGQVNEANVQENYNAFNVYATFNKQFGDHSLTVIGGYNQEEYEYERVSANRQNLISSSLPYIPLAYGDQTVGFGATEWAVQGLFGRINYIFKDRYILELNGRYDGSSRFPSDDRFGFFPSVSAAWIASEESFLQNDILSTLKLRASYGSLGNQAVSNFGYILSMPTGTSSYLINGDYPRVVNAPGLGVNPDNYTWEEVTSTNLGVDFGFLRDRIYGTFDYFIRETKGMLTPGAELPGVLGTSAPSENAADLETKGWEGSIGYRDNFKVLGKPFNFNARFIISDSRTEITDFDNVDKLLSQYYIGQEIGEIWGLESDGFFQSEEEIANLDQSRIIPWGAISIVPGWPKFVDQDGDGTIQLGNTVDESKDLKVIGNTSDRYRVGFNFDFDWNGFDARIFLQGVLQRDYYPTDYLFWGPYQQPYSNTYSHLFDYYRAEGDSEAQRAKHSQAYINAGLADANTNPEYPHLQAWLADYRVNGGLSTPQTGYLLNGAYVRIKNVTLGYTLPQAITQRFRISRLRLFVSGENLFEFSELKDFIDPEAINNVSGFDGDRGYVYPFSRRYSFGLNLDF